MTRAKEVSAAAEKVPGDGAGQDLGPQLLNSLCPQNLLSFGPETEALELRNLNVLVGPNGSGKSNVLEVVALARGTASDLDRVVRRGGGIGEWIWKGSSSGQGSFDLVARYSQWRNSQWNYQLRHELTLAKVGQSFQIAVERITALRPGKERETPIYAYRPGGLAGYIESFLEPADSVPVPMEGFDARRSILSQLRDPARHSEITYLARAYEGIRLYREWSFGRNTVFREPQRADLRTDRLEEDFSNLGLFLNSLRRKPRVKAILLSHLKDLYEGLTDFDVSVEGGTVQVFFTEGDFTIPATRLSDGSLRYLCLLAILCDPEPPPLIGIEEPELGLHPDLIPKIADLLVEASQRTQLIVTTHSDILIDALSERPECVVVCEKHDGQTTMRRLDSAELAEWLKTYRLGQLWTRGHLGGTRW